MANHKSAEKRNRQSQVRRDRNRYTKVGMKMAVKDLRTTKDKGEAEKMLPEVISKIDRAAKRHIIHLNKAANLKSALTLYVNSLS